jgi:uncharacterized membrane protein YgcG
MPPAGCLSNLFSTLQRRVSRGCSVSALSLVGCLALFAGSFTPAKAQWTYSSYTLSGTTVAHGASTAWSYDAEDLYYLPSGQFLSFDGEDECPGGYNERISYPLSTSSSGSASFSYIWGSTSGVAAPEYSIFELYVDAAAECWNPISYSGSTASASDGFGDPSTVTTNGQGSFTISSGYHFQCEKANSQGNVTISFPSVSASISSPGGIDISYDSADCYGNIVTTNTGHPIDFTNPPPCVATSCPSCDGGSSCGSGPRPNIVRAIGFGGSGSAGSSGSTGSSGSADGSGFSGNTASGGGRLTSKSKDPVKKQGYPIGCDVMTSSAPLDQYRPMGNASFTYDIHVGAYLSYNGRCRWFANRFRSA